MSQTRSLVGSSPEGSTEGTCPPSSTTKCMVLRWQLAQSRNPAAARISRRLPPRVATISSSASCAISLSIGTEHANLIRGGALFKHPGSSHGVGLVSHRLRSSGLNHRESGGTADAPDLGSGARKGVGVRLSPLARADLACAVLGWRVDLTSYPTWSAIDRGEQLFP